MNDEVKDAVDRCELVLKANREWYNREKVDNIPFIDQNLARDIHTIMKALDDATAENKRLRIKVSNLRGAIRHNRIKTGFIVVGDTDTKNICDRCRGSECVCVSRKP